MPFLHYLSKRSIVDPHLHPLGKHLLNGIDGDLELNASYRGHEFRDEALDRSLDLFENSETGLVLRSSLPRGGWIEEV